MGKKLTKAQREELGDAIFNPLGVAAPAPTMAEFDCKALIEAADASIEELASCVPIVEVPAAMLKALAESHERMREAIMWALGCIDDFPTRGPGDGAYWWRKELQQRAGLSNEALAVTIILDAFQASEGMK